MGKKIRKVLKGVAITGAAVGHASVFGDANLVLAHEADETLHTSTGEFTVELTNELELTNPVEAQEIEAANTEIEELEQKIIEAEEAQNIAYSNIEAEEAEITQAQADIAAIDEQIAANTAELEAEEAKLDVKLQEIDSVKTQVEATEQELKNVDESIDATQQEIDTATAGQESVQNEIDDAQAKIQETEAGINEKQQQYEASGYGNAGLSELEESINTKLGLADETLKGKTFISTDAYKNYLRPIAEEMIKYELVQSGEVEYSRLNEVKITYFKTKDNANNIAEYYNSHFCVRYIDSKGQLQEKYFDYVTCDSEGRSMIKTSLSDNTPDKVENYGGVNVLGKTATYHDLAGDNTTDYVYYKKADYNQLTSAEKKLYTKHTDFSGETYYYANRTGWYVEEGASVKGTDNYTIVQYKTDVDNRKNLPTEISSMQEQVFALNAEVQEKQQAVADYATTINEYSGKVSEYTDTKNSLTTSITSLSAIKTTLAQEIEVINTGIQTLKDTIADLLAKKSSLNDEINQHNENKAGYQADYAAKAEEIDGYKSNVEALKSKIEGIITALSSHTDNTPVEPEEDDMNVEEPESTFETVHDETNIYVPILPTETMVPEVSEPETVEQEVTKTEDTEAEVVETVETEVAEAEIIEEIAESEEAELEAAEFETTEAEISEPEIIESKISENQASVQEASVQVASAIASAPTQRETQTIVKTEIPLTNDTPAPQVQAPALEEVRAFLHIVDLEAPEELEVLREVEAAENELETVTIHDQEVAKAADKVIERGKWSGQTLPVIGTLAGLFGIGKLRDKSEEDKR